MSQLFISDCQVVFLNFCLKFSNDFWPTGFKLMLTSRQRMLLDWGEKVVLTLGHGRGFLHRKNTFFDSSSYDWNNEAYSDGDNSGDSSR